MTLEKKPFKNNVGKGENAGNQHLSFSHSVFDLTEDRNLNFSNIWLVVCKCFEFVQSKKLSFGSQLTLSQTTNLGVQ